MLSCEWGSCSLTHFIFSRYFFQVMVEFVSVRNLPEDHKGTLSVIFAKSQPDTIFNAKRRLSILSESVEKQVASFNCQSNGNLLFELVSHSPSNLKLSKPHKTLGSTSFSLEDFLNPISTLSVEKWLELTPSCRVDSKPIGLRVALSFSIPTPAPHVLHMVHSYPFWKRSCFFPFPGILQFAQSGTRVIDEGGNEVITLQMRYVPLFFITLACKLVKLHFGLDRLNCSIC